MKAIFSSLSLDEEKSDAPSATKGKGAKGKQGQPVVSSSESNWTSPEVADEGLVDMGGMGLGEGDAYSLGFEKGQGFWGAGQSGGAYGIPKTEGFP